MGRCGRTPEYVCDITARAGGGMKRRVRKKWLAVMENAKFLAYAVGS